MVCFYKIKPVFESIAAGYDQHLYVWQKSIILMSLFGVCTVVTLS